MPFLLMVFLTLICLQDANGWPAPVGGLAAEISVVGTALSVLLVSLAASEMSHRVCRALAREPGRRDFVLHQYERWRNYHRFLLFGFYGVALVILGWGASVDLLWRDLDGRALPGVELCVLAPFLVSLLISWLFFYDADHAAHRSAQHIFGLDPLSRAWLDQQEAPLPVQAAFGGRLAYVLFQLRQQLALVFIPLSVLLVQKELRRLDPAWWQRWEGVANLVGLLMVVGLFVGMPWLVRLALGLRPLPPGPLRDRLFAAARRLRFRCSDVLLWHTRGGMANAMVIGLVAWPRYVVFTDRLLEDFSAEEVEAVFGHEVGHVKHRHMLFYLIFLTASLFLAWLGMDAVLQLIGEWPGVAWWTAYTEQPNHQYLQMLPPVGLLLVYIFVVFGFLSRRCERQADLYGCRAVSCADADCPGHARGAALPAVGGSLCPTGIRTFIQALEKVALLNGISRDKPGFMQSWQHSTIARRVDFLKRVLVDPAVERSFQRRVAAVKWGLVAVLGVLLLLAGVSGFGA